jgi:hypothetical protein
MGFSTHTSLFPLEEGQRWRFLTIARLFVPAEASKTTSPHVVGEQNLRETIAQIQQQQFSVLEPPTQTICKSCDIRTLCRRARILN